MNRIFVLAAALLIWCSSVCLAAANDGPMYVVGNGGSVRPMKSTTIRMAAETVQAICYSRFAEYKVDFRFVNAGTTQTVLLGFPFAPPYSPPPYTGGDRYLAPAGFRAWQDGRPLAVSLMHGTENDSDMDYYTHRAVFRPGETTITVSYLLSPSLPAWTYSLDDMVEDSDGLVTTTPTAYQDEPISHGQYDYTLHTGSYWNGNIGTAVLRWALSPDFVGWGIAEANELESWVDTSDPDPEFGPTEDDLLAARIQSNYTTPSPGVYQWNLHDFSPRLPPDDWESPYDIGLHFFAPPLQAERGFENRHRAPSARASSSLRLGAYSYPAENLVDGDPSTAWAEDAPGLGVGEWVDVTLPRGAQVRELRILPGYAKRPELFSRYGRPKELRFDFGDGLSETVTLRDAPTLQRFSTYSITRKIRMTVLSVYPGTHRNETYISEVDFGSAPAPTFEDPGALLASARDLPSADTSTLTVSEVAAPSSTSQTGAQAPVSLSGRASALLLATTLLGVGTLLTRLAP